ncbi:MAG: DNA-formamidopyrimidine glycosylase family protein [Nitrosarchaeum sp.]|nr:DNA-formamidopyrimidine glycosylase family protein [Nitrosarchaeum sp.]
MPEGPEVRVITDNIEQGYKNQTFSHIEVIENTAKLHRFSKHPIENLQDIRQFKITKIETFGKLITLILTSESNTFYVLNTLGMTGSWAWKSKSHKQARLNFTAINGDDLTFIDTRCFGSFKIVSKTKWDKKIKKIGHDLLKSPLQDSLWSELQFDNTIAELPIGESLMKQHLFAGIGNIYKSEIIYECKLDPMMIVKDVPIERWSQINQVAHVILKTAYEHQGSTIRSFTANHKKGQHQDYLKIFGKKQVIEGKVLKIEQDGRTTYYCPERIQ